MVVDSLIMSTEKPELGLSHENVVVLKYGPDLLSELAELGPANRHAFDAILVDATQSGFLFTTEFFIEVSTLAKNLLQMRGALVFLKSDKAIAILRDSLMGDLSLHTFESYSELYDFSLGLAKCVENALGKSIVFAEASTDLAQQVLMSAVPILTSSGITLKTSMDLPHRRNMVLAAIDNYSPLSAINYRLESKGRLTQADLIAELKELEQDKVIYPIFPKIPFLVNCFRNHTPFRLEDYFLASKLLSRDQLDEIVLEVQKSSIKEQVILGPLAVKRGFINARQLEVALQDQAFYGQSGARKETKLVKTAGEESQVQSLVGHLGTTDPSNLLQNLSTNRETGVLSVEQKDMQFRAQFDLGRLTHAKVGKVEGNDAIVEFASAWKEGIFVFVQRMPPPDLAKESAKLTKPLDKLLLEAALAKDNMDVVLKKLSKGFDSILEKLPDPKALMNSGKLTDPLEHTPLREKDISAMIRLWNALDGLSTLQNVIKQLGDMPSYEAARAVDRLLHYGLISMPTIDLIGPLAKFQELVKSIVDEIGAEKNIALLRLSLRDIIGYSGRAKLFAVGSAGEIGVDMAIARTSGTSLSEMLKGLEDWQVKYIEYVREEIHQDKLLDIIRRVHQAR